MHISPYHFLPYPSPLLWIFLLLLAAAVALIEIGVLKYAYEKMGIQPRYVFALLLLCLLGSYINIPVAELPPEQVQSGVLVRRFGMTYFMPEVHEWPRTVLAVNLGGAIIPTLLSGYLLIKNQLYLRALLGVTVVALIVHALAHPVHGMGISVPLLIPPIAAAVVAVLLTRKKAAPLAYIVGTLGTLIGGDLMNLWALPGLGAPIASIGGAGTFDGVFLSGILAVLLA